MYWKVTDPDEPSSLLPSNPLLSHNSLLPSNSLLSSNSLQARYPSREVISTTIRETPINLLRPKVNNLLLYIISIYIERF